MRFNYEASKGLRKLGRGGSCIKIRFIHFLVFKLTEVLLLVWWKLQAGFFQINSKVAKEPNRQFTLKYKGLDMIFVINFVSNITVYTRIENQIWKFFLQFWSRVATHGSMQPPSCLQRQLVCIFQLAFI